MTFVPESRTTIQDMDGISVNWPQTYGVGSESIEGTPRMTPDLFPPGYRLWSTGAFDDLVNGIRGGGAAFSIEESEPATYAIEGQFFEHVLLVGGALHYLNGKKDDVFTFQCYAPASTPAAASGDGNADKAGLLRLSSISGTFQAGELATGGTSGHVGYIVAVVPGVGMQVANPTGAFQAGETVTGGTSGATGTAVRDPDFRGQTGTAALICAFVPNATNTGYYNVDGATLSVGEINTNLAPVGPKSNGYWSWDPDLSPSLYPYAGEDEGVRCHLLDQKVILGQQINQVPLLGSDARLIGTPMVRPVILMPHWKLRVEVVKASSNASTLTVALEANCGRRDTRP